jgi:hypothetical protein
VLGLPCAAGSSTAPLLTEHAKLIDSVETFIFDCDGICCFFPSFPDLAFENERSLNFATWLSCIA